MRKNHIRKLAILFIVLATTAIATAQKSKPKTVATPAEPSLRGSNTKEGASQANKSAQVLKEIMGAPDKGIPGDLLAKAECVAVFPKVVKAGFILAGQGGRGVASCRTSAGWSAPAFSKSRAAALGCKLVVRQLISCCSS